MVEKLRKVKVEPRVYKALPESPGIYVFFKTGIPIYIGKAINLKRRVSSYFDLDLETKTSKMMGEATELSFVRVGSELESLLLEARLIRKYMPHYNIAAKDDKHPLYIAITKEKYPRVISVRKLIANDQKIIASFGPFPSATNVRSVLRMLRRIFPYSDHKLGKRGCLYSHIGLCSPCPNQIEMTNDKLQMANDRTKYLKNIKRIKGVLSGKFDGVKKDLIREMEALSKDQDYEEASIIRNKIQALDYITQPQMPTEFYMENPNLYEDIRQKELSQLQKILQDSRFKIPDSLNRIECFDIAHFAGISPTASMVTFINGEADKTFYRHFKVKNIKGNSDVDSLREVIKRRINHFEGWGRPDLIIVDGGKPQVSTFVRELEEYKIPVVGIAKRLETLVIPTKMDGTMSFKEYRLPRGQALNLVQRIRDEAHRFARRYHHHLISKVYKDAGNS